MARSALEQGYEVVVYARWEVGLPLETTADGYRLIRVPVVTEMAVPGFRRRGRLRLSKLRRVASAPARDKVVAVAPTASGAQTRPTTDGLAGRVPRLLRGTALGAPLRRSRAAAGRWYRRLLLFPIRPIAWAVAIDEVAEPADLWHGMWATSLPALERLRRTHGGQTIYDSRDIYIHARSLAGMGRLWKWLLGGLERHWARRCDAVITVNDAYADILADQLRIARPAVVRNTPARYEAATPRPDLIRGALGLPATVSIVLYQGGLMSERGIEQGMAAILEVPAAVLVLMGFGSGSEDIIGLAGSPRYADRVRVIPPVAPAELLDWTASSDVMLMAIQPTSLNHRFTTPNKLWEAIAAGVPVVASDLPGMAAVVRETGCGELVDPTDPAAIAGGIRTILESSATEREALRARCRAAGAVYAWERQTDVLFGLYRRLLDGG